MAGKKKTKRTLTDWNKFVMKVKANHPEKTFSDVLKMAGKMKRQGVKMTEYINNKTFKAAKKIKKSATAIVKKIHKTGKKKLAKKKVKRKTVKKR
jgi:hypothetical protein